MGRYGKFWGRRPGQAIIAGQFFREQAAQLNPQVYLLFVNEWPSVELFVVSVLESIVKDLEALPVPKLVEVAHYVSGLNPKRREERLAAIRATAGCLSGDSGADFERLVSEEASRIDADGPK